MPKEGLLASEYKSRFECERSSVQILTEFSTWGLALRGTQVTPKFVLIE